MPPLSGPLLSPGGAIISPETLSPVQEPISPIGPIETSPLRPPTSGTAYTVDVVYENVQSSPAPRLEGVVIRITGSLKSNPKLKAMINSNVITKVLYIYFTILNRTITNLLIGSDKFEDTIRTKTIETQV